MTPEETLAAREAIVRKGLRLQIATELLAAKMARDGLHDDSEAAKAGRRRALEQADALIRENEVMP
jgi:hypothetical protein